jgi:pyrroline-5-carboxylate reductase
MGIAVLSGVLESLDTSKRPLSNGIPKWEVHTSGTVSPVGSPDPSTPSHFIACVSRQSSAKKLVSLFGSMGELARQVEVLASKNVEAVKQADVILLWYV